jgi:hypothetical protein
VCALLDAIQGAEAVDLDVSEHGPTLTVAVGHCEALRRQILRYLGPHEVLVAE